MNASFTSEPYLSHISKPPPKETPLTAGIPKIALERLPSSVSKVGSPTPTGKPIIAVSNTPPTES